MFEVASSGDERSFSQCPFAAPGDIYCSHDEDVVVSCAGVDSNAQLAASKKEAEAQNFGKRSFKPPAALGCADKLNSSKHFLGTLPGDLVLVQCPSGCK